jgi:hypothetical protein
MPQTVEKVTAGSTGKWAGLDAACAEKKLASSKMSPNAHAAKQQSYSSGTPIVGTQA